MSIYGNLVLVRGIPSSGKSTFAKENYVNSNNYILFEADMYFIDKDGNYNYDVSKITLAHEWCYEQTKMNLIKGNSVIVANTFTRMWEINKYLALNPSKIYRCNKSYKNTHNISSEVINKMLKRFQDIKGEIIV